MIVFGGIVTIIATLAGAAPDGSDGGACYGNGTCNAGLRCDAAANQCIAPVDGGDGGACYGNGTCNSGLTCTQGTCAATKAAPSASSPSPAGAKLRVLVLDLEAKAVNATDAQLIDGSVAKTLSEISSLEVLTKRDLSHLAETQADRTMAGCDTASCLAEIAEAMGTRYVVYGRVGKLGELFVVQLELFDSQEAKAVAREEARAPRVEALPRVAAPAARKLVTHLVGDVGSAKNDPTVEAVIAYKELRQARGAQVFRGFGRGLTTAGASTIGTGIVAAAGAAALGGNKPDEGEAGGAAIAAFGVAGTIVGGAVWLLSALVNADVSAEEQQVDRAFADNDVDASARAKYGEAESAAWQGSALRDVGLGLVCGSACGAIGAAALAGGDQGGPAAVAALPALAGCVGGAGLFGFGLLRASDGDRAATELDEDIVEAPKPGPQRN